MKTASIRWLMVLALAFYASGVAQFTHEVLDHSDDHPRVPRLVERALRTAAAAGSQSTPQNHHHHDHDDCPVCQVFAAMHFSPAHVAPAAVRPEPSIEITFSPSLVQPAAPMCDGCRLARPPPFQA